MRNVCGPYSRAYELEMTVHTALPAVLYMAGIDEAVPPLSIETDCNPVLVLSDIRIPQTVRPLLRQGRGERQVCHRFEELAERGDPRDNHALCTTTAWITDTLMLGAMSGSKNTSYQLHPAVVFWRNSLGSLSTIKLLRRSAEGELQHFHTVYMDFTAEPHRLTGTVRACAGRDILPYFEIESPGLEQAVLTDDAWTVCGLRVTVSATVTAQGQTGPAPRQLWRRDNVLRVGYPLKDGETLTVKLGLDLN